MNQPPTGDGAPGQNGDPRDIDIAREDDTPGEDGVPTVSGFLEDNGTLEVVSTSRKRSSSPRVRDFRRVNRVEGEDSTPRANVVPTASAFLIDNGALEIAGVSRDDSDPSSSIFEDTTPSSLAVADPMLGIRVPRPTSDEYNEYKSALRYGTQNPSNMANPFWTFQVGPESLSPEHARMVFGQMSSDPVWSFERIGTADVRLSDGRHVYIGGEQDIYGEADFCMYNGKYSPICFTV